MTGTSDYINTFCNKSSSADELRTCFEDNTFTLNETLMGVVYSLAIKEDILVNNNPYVTWNITASNVYLGRCHTLLFTKPLLADMITDALGFGLNPEMSYRVLLHDQNYYLLASNPMVFPRIWVEYPVPMFKFNHLQLSTVGKQNGSRIF